MIEDAARVSDATAASDSRYWPPPLLPASWQSSAPAAVPPTAQPSGAQPFSGPGIVEPAATAFLQPPSMGVACGIPNSIACDRLGLAVWLTRRATVTATIADGPPIRLDDPHWSYFVRYHGQAIHVYAGFLQPAGLTTRFHIIPKPKTQTWMAPPPMPPRHSCTSGSTTASVTSSSHRPTSCSDRAGVNETTPRKSRRSPSASSTSRAGPEADF